MNRKDAEDAKGFDQALEVLGAPRRSEPSKALNEISQRVIGAAIEVHRTLGPGFLESVYEDAMMVELELRSLRAARQVNIPVRYKGRSVGDTRIDLLVEDELVVELEAVESFVPSHTAQLLSYLKAGAFPLGLLIHFNVPLLRHGIRRLVLTETPP